MQIPFYEIDRKLTQNRNNFKTQSICTTANVITLMQFRVAHVGEVKTRYVIEKGYSLVTTHDSEEVEICFLYKLILSHGRIRKHFDSFPLLNRLLPSNLKSKFGFPSEGARFFETVRKCDREFMYVKCGKISILINAFSIFGRNQSVFID